MERYQNPLRQIFNTIQETDPKLYGNSKLRVSVNEMTYTMGHEDLIASLLGFEKIARFYHHHVHKWHKRIVLSITTATRRDVN